METSPVIHLVTDAKGNVLHEVHVQMQELPVSETKALGQEVSAICVGGRWGDDLVPPGEVMEPTLVSTPESP